MNDNKSNLTEDLGESFNNDMERLNQQRQEPADTDNLYEDLMQEDTEEGAVKEVDPDDPLQGESIRYNAVEEQELQQVYTEPSEDEILAAEEGFPEIDDVDEPLFLGGPLKSEIDSWKKQFKDQAVFITEVAGQYFIVRTLNRYEYKQIIAIPNTDPLMREEIFCHTCVLWPRPYDWKSMATGKSGIPSTLATIIMEQSGFVKNYELEVL